MDIFFEIEIFVLIVVFGTVPYFVFVYVLVMSFLQYLIVKRPYSTY